MEQQLALKVNKAADYLQKVVEQKNDNTTRSLSEKMSDSLSSINKNTDRTNDILTKIETTSNKQTDKTTSFFSSLIKKFLPSKDMNRTDDNDEKTFREKILSGIGGIGDKLKGLKDKGIFGLLFALLSGLMKGLFKGLMFGLKRILFPLVSALFRHAVLPLLSKISVPLANMAKTAAQTASKFVRKGTRRLGRRAAVAGTKFLRRGGAKIAAKGGLKGIAKVAGPVGIAVAALDAGVTAVHAIANAGKTLKKNEVDVTVFDRYKVGMAGVASSLSFGLISVEDAISYSDKISDGLGKAFRTVQKGFNKALSFVSMGFIKENELEKLENKFINFGKRIFKFADFMLTDLTSWLTGGTFWEDWRNGWEYMKTGLVSDIKSFFSGMIDGVKNELNSILGGWELIGKTFSESIVGKFFGYVMGEIKAAAAGWKLMLQQSGIYTFFADVGNAILSGISTIKNKLMSFLPEVIKKNWEKAGAAVSGSNTPTPATPSAVQPTGTVQPSDVSGLAKQKEKAIQSTVKNAFSTPASKAYSGMDKNHQLLAIFMDFMLGSFAPNLAKLNAEAVKGTDLSNVGLVEPMR